MYDPSQAKLIDELATSQRRLYGVLLTLVPISALADAMLREVNLAMMTQMASLDSVGNLRSWALTAAVAQATAVRAHRRQAGEWCFDDELSGKLAESAKVRALKRQRVMPMQKALREMPATERATLQRYYGAKDATVDRGTVRTLRRQLWRRVERPGKSEAPVYDKWTALVDAVLEDATAERGANLAAVLGESAEAREFYCAYLAVHAYLLWEFAESVDLETRHVMPKTPRRVIPWKLEAVAALVLVFGAAVWLADEQPTASRAQLAFEDVGDVAGAVGKGLRMDGRPLAIHVASGDDRHGTLSLWLRAPLADGRRLARKRFGAREAVVQLNADPELGPVGALQFQFGGHVIVGKQDLRDGRWHHVVGTVSAESAGTMLELFIDDRLVGAVQAPSASPPEGFVVALPAGADADEVMAAPGRVLPKEFGALE